MREEVVGLGTRQRVGGLLRRAGRATPPGLRRPLGRATRRIRAGNLGPLVSVIVHVSDDETTRIGPCLESVRGQSHHNLDIVVVRYGRSQQVAARAGEHARADWRVRLLSRQAEDRNAARNLAAQHARGAYLMFVAGGDDLPVHGVRRLVDSLERSGSVLAVGNLRMPRSAAPSGQPFSGAAHVRDRRGTTLHASPEAATDLMIGNRLFGARFWRRSGLRFGDGVAADARLALEAYAAAPGFDLLRSVTYTLSNRSAGLTVGAVRGGFPELSSWIAGQRELWAALEHLGTAEVRAWWSRGILDVGIGPFLEDIERADDAAWAALRDHVRRLLAGSSDSLWSTLASESRVRLWLLLHDRREQLEEFVTARLFEDGQRPTQVVDGVVVARLPFLDDVRVGVPRECYTMGEDETPLEATLHGVRWVAPERLELDIYVRVAHVGFDGPPRVTAALVRSGARDRLPVTVRQGTDPCANHRAGHRYQDYSAGAVTVEVDVAALAERCSVAASAPAAAITRGDGASPDGRDPPRPGSWRLQLLVEMRGLTRRGTVTAVDERGSAGMSGNGHLAPRLVGDLRIGTAPDDAGGVVIRVAADPGVRLRNVRLEGRTISAELASGRPVTSVRVAGPGGVEVRATPTRAGETYDVILDVPESTGHARWDLWAELEGGGDLAIAWPPAEGQWLGVGSGSLVLSRSPQGDTHVLEAADTLVVDTVVLRGDHLVVEGRWLGTPPPTPWLTLRGDRLTLDAEVTSNEVAGFRARFPTTWDEWGFGPADVPTGTYWFGLDPAGGAPGAPKAAGRVLLGAGLLERLLVTQVSERFRMRPCRAGREAGVLLQAPLADEERGPHAQASMQRWAASGDLPLEQDSVYLQSYTGFSATDSQLEIHHELRRRHPDLRLHWGVADGSVRLPDGGVPVQMHSREWYRVLGSAGYLCLNIDLDRWFARRPGQRVLQTFHGYPAKSMGIRMWEAKNFTPRRIDLELARTSGCWDLILTPAPEMDRYYRTEYRYDGPIHHAGYPRDDPLVSPSAASVREETRRRLGIGPDQKVVLYAPTWRDDLATTWRSAELTDLLDLDSASRALGPDYVFLMRGHRFHSRQSARGSGNARLLDVTSYPEINHLILAADAAVLDYSSLRFDFALTGRPMVFLVPDLAAYTGNVRGFLFDYRASAPGPLVDTAEQAVALLGDLAGLSESTAQARAAFNATYNYLQDGKAAARVVQAFIG